MDPYHNPPPPPPPPPPLSCRQWKSLWSLSNTPSHKTSQLKPLHYISNNLLKWLNSRTRLSKKKRWAGRWPSSLKLLGNNMSLSAVVWYRSSPELLLSPSGRGSVGKHPEVSAVWHAKVPESNMWVTVHICCEPHCYIDRKFQFPRSLPHFYQH